MRSMRCIFMSGRARHAGALAAAAFVLSIAACSDGAISGPGDDGGEDTGTVTFYVGNPSQGAAALMPAALASISGSLPPVDPEQIASLEIVVNLLEAHLAGGEGSATGTPRWVSIPLDPPVVIDPTVVGPGEFDVVATVEVPPGDYDLVRLIPESVTIQFQTSSSTTPIVVGQHEYAPAPATHDVTVPSGRILIPTAHLTVDESGGVMVMLWDDAGTAASIIATGSGRINLRPVFLEADEETENELEGG